MNMYSASLSFPIRAMLSILFKGLCLCVLVLAGGCKAQDPNDEMYPSSIVGYNLTHEGVQEFYVNGAWGSNIGSYGGGGGKVCCVTLPKQWRPGLAAEVDWRIGDYKKDGRSMTADERDAMPINELIEKHWVERRLKRWVPIEPYPPEGGTLQVVFLPNDEVKIYVVSLNMGMELPEHPGHHLWQQSKRDPQRLQFEKEMEESYRKRAEKGIY